jgi:antitoxin component YwqK of YwqJK toxin-antitoxin module
MTVKRVFSTIILGILLLTLASGQGTINRTDENGQKQGKWMKKFENGNTLYEGTFLNDKPVGEFKRYYISGKLISVLTYHESSDSIDAIFYHPNEYLAAKGRYNDRAKEGEWVFYSTNQEDFIICIETYINNKKEGKSTKYHYSGQIAEEHIYRNDIKHGAWTQYFTDGVTCIRSQFISNKVNGSFETFHPNGKKEITGTYVNDTREGAWLFYNDDGSLKQTIKYNKGIAENDLKLIEEETRYLDMLEKNGGKIQDPEKTGIIW